MINSPHLDFLIRLKNAYLAGNKSVVLPPSKLILSISDILLRHHLIAGFDSKNDLLTINLDYSRGYPAFTKVTIFSKPGRRFYQKTFSLPWGKTRESLIIVSTSKGLMSQKEAKKAGLGGEIFAELF